MRWLDFFFAARPLLQLPIWTVYLVALDRIHQQTGESFALANLATMAGISLLFTGAAYLNQVHDLESDRINNKVGFLQKGFLTVRQLKLGFWIVAVLAIVIAALMSTFIQILFGQFLLLAWLYSAPPARLKDRAVFGLLANAHAHGLLVALAAAPVAQLGAVSDINWQMPGYFALTVGATYILTTIPDRDGDQSTGKRTIAVALGRTKALLASLVLLAAAAGLAGNASAPVLTYLAIGAVFLVLACLMLRTEASVRLASKLPLLALTVVAGSCYPVYLVFVVALLIATRTYYFKRFGIIYPELA